MIQNEFIARREELMDLIGAGGIAILPSAKPQIRNRDVYYPYRQESNFYYLTGFSEPDALVVLIPERKAGEYFLFCREGDLEGVDYAFPIDLVDEIVPSLIANCRRLYYPIAYDREFDERIKDWIDDIEVFAIDQLLQEMRLFKTQAEVAAIQQAIDISINAHKRAMQFCRPGLYEYELEAEITHEFLRNGCRSLAYPIIVAGGANACTLHYTNNNCMLKDGDLVLIDAGVEFDYYASDITRTFPINGKFNPFQRNIYDLVLTIQTAIIDQVKPGNSWNILHETGILEATKGLVDLGFVVDNLDQFYVPHISHYLGIDVHDPVDYKIEDTWRELEPGMVMTIEPGLYIPANKNIPTEYWDIGIRIEDIILITENGYKILTAAMPKTAAEIEAMLYN